MDNIQGKRYKVKEGTRPRGTQGTAKEQLRTTTKNYENRYVYIYVSRILLILPLRRAPYLRYPKSGTKKIKKELIKLEHAGRNGGGRNGGRAGVF